MAGVISESEVTLVTDTARDDVYTGPTIEEDICEEAIELGRALVWVCIDSALAMMVAVIFVRVYFHPAAEWIDALGTMLVGIGHVSILLPLLSVTLVALSISRLNDAVRLWRERHALLL